MSHSQRWRRAEGELDGELRFHLEMAVEEMIRRGVEPGEARRRALAELGGMEAVKEGCREARRGYRWEMLLRDVRLGFRRLRREPAFTVAAGLTLALGIGANTAIFSLVHGVLLRPLPYQGGGDLVLVRQSEPGAGIDNLGFAINELYDYREGSESLDLVEYHGMSFTMVGEGEPDQVATGVVSWQFFDVLGLEVLHGRAFLPEDDEMGAEAVLVLSNPYWRKKFGGDPEVVGKAVQMNDRTHTIVGVLPPIPQFPNPDDVYMPVSACPFRAFGEEQRVERRRAFGGLTVFGRLRNGVSIERARAELQAVGSRFAERFPDVYTPEQGYEVDAEPLREALTDRARPMLLTLLGVTALVLLVACTNVANLSVVQALRRERELALRSALGATRWRLARQSLVESTLVALGGGALGVALAYGGLDLLSRFTSRFTPRAVEVEIDLWVLLFALVVSVGTGLVFGLLPALVSRPELARALHQGSRGTERRAHQRLRSLLIAAQVALSMVVLAGAGLMLRSFYRLSRVDPGFVTDSVLSARVPLDFTNYPDGQSRRAFYERLLARLEQSPQVVSAAVGIFTPLSNPFHLTRAYQVEGRPPEAGRVAPQLHQRVVSEDYFQTLRIPLLTGRTFRRTDDPQSAPVAVAGRTLARRLWGVEKAVGQRLSLDGGETWITVVGVVGDIRMYGLETDVTDDLYLPLAQAGGGQSLLIRTRGDTMAVAAELRQAVWDLDPRQPVEDLQPLEYHRRESMATPRTTALLIGLFALVALGITATGLGSVIAYSVGQRTREIGLRRALGAREHEVLSMVLGQGLKVVAAGLVVGLGAALALGRLVQDQLFEVAPRDPWALTVSSVALLLAALVACYLPARRATRIHPTVALRSE